MIASTSEVYGDPEVHPQPETYWGHVNPIGIYYKLLYKLSYYIQLININLHVIQVHGHVMMKVKEFQKH